MNPSLELPLAIGSILFLLLLGALVLFVRQMLAERRQRARMHHLAAMGLHVPASLHPVLDPDRCIGSAACVTACPEGDVLVYRGDGFFRAKAPNRERVEELRAQGRLQIRLGCDIAAIEPGRVTLRDKSGEAPVRADFVLPMLGGDPPAALLHELGVRLDRRFGSVPEGHARDTHIHTRARRDPWWLGNALFVAGLLCVATLWWVGRDYYVLSPAERDASPLHDRLRSSGPWGQSTWISASASLPHDLAASVRARALYGQAGTGLELWSGVTATNWW